MIPSKTPQFSAVQSILLYPEYVLPAGFLRWTLLTLSSVGRPAKTTHSEIGFWPPWRRQHGQYLHVPAGLRPAPGIHDQNTEGNTAHA
eukprot:2809794-Pyramimonas_sp.AAC.1